MQNPACSMGENSSFPLLTLKLTHKWRGSFVYDKAWSESVEATYNPILHTEAQLVSEVWSSDQDSGYWRTSNYVQLNPGLVFQALKKTNQIDS